MSHELPFDKNRSAGTHTSTVQLMLHLDGQADLMHAMRTVMELLRFCVDEATHKMWQAHHEGKAPLLALHRERAELYAEQFAERGLNVTLEKFS
ncbi:MAG: ATP-dependent Clp protease adaptor ClpS [Gemmataceae bacterium]